MLLDSRTFPDMIFLHPIAGPNVVAKENIDSSIINTHPPRKIMKKRRVKSGRSTLGKALTVVWSIGLWWWFHRYSYHQPFSPQIWALSLPFLLNRLGGCVGGIYIYSSKSGINLSSPVIAWAKHSSARSSRGSMGLLPPFQSDGIALPVLWCVFRRWMNECQKGSVCRHQERGNGEWEQILSVICTPCKP